MSIFVSHNGKLLRDTDPVLLSGNRSFRYGDGLFETMRIKHGKIIRSDMHFARLFNSLAVLRYQLPPQLTPGYFSREIMNVVDLNKHTDSARVRLSIYRGNGDLHNHEDHHPCFLIQSMPLESTAGEWNVQGITAAVYPDVKKSCDKFSQLKTSNFLPYAMAAIFAQENKLHDAIVLNSSDRICDATTANIFAIKDDKIITPPLSEGCVAGTFRKFLLSQLKELQFTVTENPLTPEDLLSADEVFLTNAIQQIRWVREINNSQFGCDQTMRIYSLISKHLSA
jgi:branched-chain amino acid aminotransferase